MAATYILGPFRLDAETDTLFRHGHAMHIRQDQIRSLHQEIWQTRMARPGYAVTFKCLLPNDPAIAKYQLQPAPNIIIEQRNR
jgi:hypothetical protein